MSLPVPHKGSAPVGVPCLGPGLLSCSARAQLLCLPSVESGGEPGDVREMILRSWSTLCFSCTCRYM